MNYFRKIVSYLIFFTCSILAFLFFFQEKKFKKIAYAHSPGSKCNYLINFENKINADYSVFGGSAILTAFSYDKGETNSKIKKIFNKEIILVNNAHSGYDIGKEYLILKDFYKNNTSKYIIMMFEPQFKDNKIRMHKDFVKIASLLDIYEISKLDKQEAIKTLKKNINFRLKRSDKKINVSEKYAKNVKKSRNCYFDKKEPNKFLTEKEGVNKKYYDLFLNNKNKVEKIKKTYYKNTELSRKDKFFLKKIIELSKKNNSKVIFIYMRGIKRNKLNDKFKINFVKFTKHKLLTLDNEIEEIFYKDYINLLYDVNHINRNGREIFIPWFFNKIKNEY